MPKVVDDPEPVDVVRLEQIQNRLAAALLKTAKATIAAKDWVQGGWSRSGKVSIDKLEFGTTKAAKLSPSTK